MIPKPVLDLMQCPSCGHPDLALGNRRQPDLVCEVCNERYAIKDGIADMVPTSKIHTYRYYRTDSMMNFIASVYDAVAPVMCLLAWQCPPLRYIDRTHVAIGRANDGAFAQCPVGTGLLLGHVGTHEGKGPKIGLDFSWRMLEKARERFATDSEPSEEVVTLIHCDPAHMPFRDGVLPSLQSPNGLHTFHDRLQVLREFNRVLAPGGFLSGSALIRGHNIIADGLLGLYERYGLFPIPRSREFTIREVEQALGWPEVLFETHGSVLFYSGSKPTNPDLIQPAEDLERSALNLEDLVE